MFKILYVYKILSTKMTHTISSGLLYFAIVTCKTSVSTRLNSKLNQSVAEECEVTNFSVP